MLSPLMTRLHAPIYAARLRELVVRITPNLEAGDRLLDVGCGNGTLTAALLEAPDAPEGLVCEGLERFPRGGEPLTVTGYDGGRFPFDDDSFDVVTIADVLHHEPEPEELLRECGRVARRLVIIKDHQVKGLLAQPRISLIDWAANAPYGVKCLYRYNTPAGWSDTHQRLGFGVREEVVSMNRYPPVVTFMFGRSLQYMAVLEPPTT